MKRMDQGHGIIKAKGMKKSDRIPDEVPKEIFPKKLKRSQTFETVYTQLKQMILAAKLMKGQRLMRDEIAHNFNVNERVVNYAFSQRKKDGLIISKSGVGSFVKDTLGCLHRKN